MDARGLIWSLLSDLSRKVMQVFVEQIQAKFVDIVGNCKRKSCKKSYRAYMCPYDPVFDQNIHAFGNILSSTYLH